MIELTRPSLRLPVRSWIRLAGWLYAPGDMQYSEYYGGSGGALSFLELADLHSDPFQLENGFIGGVPTGAADLAAALFAAKRCDGAACP